MNGGAFVLKIADVLRIGWDFDRDELIDPHVMMSTPNFAERAGAELLVEEVFADSLVR
jgi:hypothetical protein